MPMASPKNICHIIYDAGSSGTRLFVYEESGTNLIAHSGPKVRAIADPLRGINESQVTDIDSIVSDVISTLDLIKSDGDLHKGKPRWVGFDWVNQCNVVSARIYATAGMRIAEQSNPEGSLIMWQTLTQKLAEKFGSEVLIETKTVTGFEEGLFAWLSVQDTYIATDFGIVDMGGASSQVTFACPDCSLADDAVKKVRLNGKPIQIYSYSYLGLGQDEAPKSLTSPVIDPVPKNCAFGIGATQKEWSVADCADDILLTIDGTSSEIKDPYNYSWPRKKGTTRSKGATNTLPDPQKNIPKWTLTGAFNYKKETDINQCCFNKSHACYKAQTACFIPIYLDKYLQTLNISPAQTTTKDVSWTRGAVLCEIENCLADVATPPVCRWMASGCLRH
ncbi:nucleoside phosphatase GDA1/CD39 [Paraglaciecola sp. T6c]|nr:nucleoside phosphatase GDA1/CD39 [Paraglaciecola sp. T6c]